jgi:hypothetical protein
VIAALFNIMYDDGDDTNWSESEADEMCAAMEALPSLHKINPFVNVKHVCGVSCGATNIVDLFCHPSAALVRMPSSSKDAES